MREIVRSAINDNVQFAAIEWNNENLMQQKLMLFESLSFADALSFNETVEQLYKKWLVGEEADFSNKFKLIDWDVAQQLTPTFLIQPEKNEYLARKAQKLIQQQYSAKQYLDFTQKIETLENTLAAKPEGDAVIALNNELKQLDEQVKAAVAATKNLTIDQKWVEHGITNDAYLELKPKINALFDGIKEIKSNSFHISYSTIAPKVEAAYAQSKVDENFSEARKDLIALQKEVIALDLERWQKNELLDRVRAAFDHINARQDEWRAKEDSKRAAHADTLQAQFDAIIPRALEMKFSEGFSQLRELQDIFQKASLQKEKREVFYKRLDEAFKQIKEKADSETETNFATAQKVVEVALLSANDAELFKDARNILTAAQGEIREIRLSKQQKDDLYAKIRTAFNELNEKQDAFFSERKKENRTKLEDVLQNFKRIIERKKEGMERLYQAQANAENKLGMFKPSNKSNENSNELLDQFRAKHKEITAKIDEAEKDIVQLEKKVEKIERELTKAKEEGSSQD